MVIGRPPNSGSGLSAHAVRSVLSALAPPKGSHGVVLHLDQTPLPRALTHPGSVGAHHVAASGSVIVTTFAGLAVVVALIYGLYWLLKRYGGNKGGKSDGRMRVLATTMLAPNRSLHLVKVGSELVLVGSAENSVSPIRIYSAAESAVLRHELEGEPPQLRPARGFGQGWAGFVTELRARTARQ